MPWCNAHSIRMTDALPSTTLNGHVACTDHSSATGAASRALGNPVLSCPAGRAAILRTIALQTPWQHAAARNSFAQRHGGRLTAHHHHDLGVGVQQDAGGLGPVLKGGVLVDEVAHQRRQPQAQPVAARHGQLL